MQKSWKIEFLQFAEYLEKIDLQKFMCAEKSTYRKKICEIGHIQKKKFAKLALYRKKNLDLTRIQKKKFAFDPCTPLDVLEKFINDLCTSLNIIGVSLNIIGVVPCLYIANC